MKCKQCGKEYDVKETQRVYGDADWTNSICSAACYTAFVLEQTDKTTARCSCGNTEFYAHQLCRLYVVCDGDGNWIRNTPSDDSACYDADNPFGPFRCTVCKKEYEELMVSKWWGWSAGEKVDFLEKQGLPSPTALKWVADEKNHRTELQEYIDALDVLNS